MWVRLWLSCVLWVLTMGPGHAQTHPSNVRQDFILEQAFWENPDAQADFETARQQIYTPYQGTFRRGYTDSVHWIRLTLAPSDTALGLLISPAWLDHITLYDPARSEPPVTLGDRHPHQQEALAALGHVFELPPASHQRDIWLRLQTTSSHILNAQAMTMEGTSQVATRQTVWASLYASILLLILLVLLYIWWRQRDQLLGAYLVRHSIYTLYGTTFLGLPTLLLADWFAPAFFDQLFSYSTTLVFSLGVWFDVLFLSRYRPQKHLLMLLKTVAVLSFGSVITLLLGHTRMALQANVILLMVSMVIVTITALSCKSHPEDKHLVSPKVMTSYYTLVYSGLLFSTISLTGWVRFGDWVVYGLILHGLVSGLVMTTMLLVRAQRMVHMTQQMRWQLQQAQQDMAQIQRQREEQSQFLHMLMHELKTPLSVVSLSLGTKNRREENLEHAGRAVQDMKAIIDRCVQADQLGQLTRPQHRQAVDVAQLIRQLAQGIPALPARLQITAPQHLPAVQVDPQLLQIVLNNLLDNAQRYSDPVTPIQLWLASEKRHDQDGLSVRLGNTFGLAGWPDERQLFSKYYRSNGAQRESGSGLGLFLARQLAQSLGGALEYAPSTQLVEFVLWIPLTPA